MKVTFGEFTPEDFDAILALDRQSYPEYARYTAKQLKDLFSDPDVLCYLVKTEDNTVIGGCILKLKKFSHSMRLISITVVKDAERAGVGSMIIENIRRMGEYLKLEDIRIQVEKKNTGAIGFFEKHNFRETKELDDFLTKGNAGMEMTLELDAPKKKKLHVHKTPAKKERRPKIGFPE